MAEDRKVSEEMIARLKEAGSAEELRALAREGGVEIVEEEAKIIFGILNMPEEGELAEDELDAVAGGVAPLGVTGALYFDSFKDIIDFFHSKM